MNLLRIFLLCSLLSSFVHAQYWEQKDSVAHIRTKTDYSTRSQTPIKEAQELPEGVSMKFEAITEEGHSFILINNTKDPVFFVGTSVSNPHYYFEIPWRNGETRVARPHRWCGTGVRGIRLQAKHSCKFTVKAEKTKFRLGLDYWADEKRLPELKKIVWSATVDPEG